MHRSTPQSTAASVRAIAESRLALLPDGRVCYELKGCWNDGTTHVVREPQVLLERLVALVPRWEEDEEERAGCRH